MIRCTISRGSSSARLLRAACRNHTSNASSTAGTRRRLEQVFQESTIATSPDKVIETLSSGSNDIDAGARAVGGEDTGPTFADWEKYLGPSLDDLDIPMSPFMDPEVIEAKSQWHSPKAPPGDNPTDFQIQLAKNPFARMLATPVRQCFATKVFLPSFFLQEFNTMAHPVTQRPWIVPRNLTKKYRHEPRTASSGHIGLREPTDAHVQVVENNEQPPNENETLNTIPEGPSQLPAAPLADLGNNIRQPEMSNQDSTSPAGMNACISTAINSIPPSSLRGSPSGKPNSQQLQIGTSYYVMSRQRLIRSFSEENSGYEDQWTQMSSERIRKVVSAKKIKDATKWRTDMDTFILELMRRRLVEHLNYLAHLKRGYASGSVSWEDATLAKRQPGAILWTGKYTAEPDSLVQDGFAEQIIVPEFSTLKTGKDNKKVAVYNLRRLLGSEHLARLRKESSIFKKEIVVIRDKKMSIELRMQLWKLEGYMANYASWKP